MQITISNSLCIIPFILCSGNVLIEPLSSNGLFRLSGVMSRLFQRLSGRKASSQPHDLFQNDVSCGVLFAQEVLCAKAGMVCC
jgi:hypothetical protein